MLTLFPRIRPNPSAPPPLPLEPPHPKAAESASEPVLIEIKEPKEHASAVDAAAETPSPEESASSQDKDALGIETATSVSDSDVFSAFLSGMAAGNSEPFIVEITGQAPRTVARPKEYSEPSNVESQTLPKHAAEVAATPVTEARSAEQAVAALPDMAVAPIQNSEPAGDAIPTQDGAGSEHAIDAPPGLVLAAANIFDELDVLHEAAATGYLQPEAPSSDAAREISSSTKSLNDPVGGAVAESVEQQRIEEQPPAQDPVAEPESPSALHQTVSETTAASQDERSTAEILTQDQAPSSDAVQLTTEPPSSADSLNEIANSRTAAQKNEPSLDSVQPSISDVAPKEASKDSLASAQSTSSAPAPVNAKPREETPGKAAAHSSSLRPPKPRRAKGTFFGLARVPEPETMDDSGEVEAYASAAAQSHLDAIDDTFVAHAQLLLRGRERGRVLDIGTGPGHIVIKLGYRLTRWKFVGIDRSATMIKKAMESLATAGELAGRVEFQVANGSALNFPDKTFEMVICNSVLHHLTEPQRLFSEMARVVKPGGAILLRDLRRPSRPGYAFHVWKHGRHYGGEMRRLFIASVQAAYTEEELRKMIAASNLRDVRVFRHGKTHIGFERPIAIPTVAKR